MPSDKGPSKITSGQDRDSHGLTVSRRNPTGQRVTADRSQMSQDQGPTRSVLDDSFRLDDDKPTNSYSRRAHVSQRPETSNRRTANQEDNEGGTTSHSRRRVQTGVSVTPYYLMIRYNFKFFQ